MLIPAIGLGVLLSLSATAVQSQTGELPRRGSIGLALGPSDAGRAEDPASNPPAVKTVLPGTAAEAAGIQAGDVVQQLDGVFVSSSTVFAREIGRRRAGETVRIGLVRDGKPLTVSAVLKPRPVEQSPDAEVLYRWISVDGSRRRVIVTRPKADGRYPAVLIMGGLGCYSLDGELMRPIGYGPILTALAKRQFVTMRVEKTGEGDSEGPLCTDAAATAELEARGYVEGLRALKAYDFVDAAKVFVFAHSLGPIIGSLVVPQEPVRGFIAAETIGRSWFEYLVENARRQRPMSGMPMDQVEDEVRALERCAHRFFVEHEPQAEVEKRGPACASMIRSFAGVPGPYMQQIGDISLPKQWKQVDIPVLVIYGTSDPATSADESRYLVGIINSFHPGRATYLEIAGMGHDFTRSPSQRDYLNRGSEPRPYEMRIVDSILEWLDTQTRA